MSETAQSREDAILEIVDARTAEMDPLDALYWLDRLGDLLDDRLQTLFKTLPPDSYPTFDEDGVMSPPENP